MPPSKTQLYTSLYTWLAMQVREFPKACSRNTKGFAQISSDKSVCLLGETGEKLKKGSKWNKIHHPVLSWIYSELSMDWKEQDYEKLTLNKSCKCWEKCDFHCLWKHKAWHLWNSSFSLQREKSFDWGLLWRELQISRTVGAQHNVRSDKIFDFLHVTQLHFIKS